MIFSLISSEICLTSISRAVISSETFFISLITSVASSRLRFNTAISSLRLLRSAFKSSTSTSKERRFLSRSKRTSTTSVSKFLADNFAFTISGFALNNLISNIYIAPLIFIYWKSYIIKKDKIKIPYVKDVRDDSYTNRGSTQIQSNKILKSLI